MALCREKLKCGRSAFIIQFMAQSFKKEIGEMINRLYPDYDPVAALAGIAQDDEVDISVRVRCHETVAKYLHAQLKAIEVRIENPVKQIQGVKLNVVRANAVH